MKYRPTPFKDSDPVCFEGEEEAARGFVMVLPRAAIAAPQTLCATCFMPVSVYQHSMRDTLGRVFHLHCNPPGNGYP